MVYRYIETYLMHLLFICYIDVLCTLLHTHIRHVICNIIPFTSDCYKTFSLFTIHVYTQNTWYLVFNIFPHWGHLVAPHSSQVLACPQRRRINLWRIIIWQCWYLRSWMFCLFVPVVSRNVIPYLIVSTSILKDKIKFSCAQLPWSKLNYLHHIRSGL